MSVERRCATVDRKHIASGGTPVQAAGHQPLIGLLAGQQGRWRRPGADGADGPSIPGHAVLRDTPDGRVAEESGLLGQQETCQAADETHGGHSHLPAPQHQ